MMILIGVLFAIFAVLALFWTAVAVIFKKEIDTVFHRDPAAVNYLEVLLTYSGLHAIIFYRIAHVLRKAGMPEK